MYKIIKETDRYNIVTECGTLITYYHDADKATITLDKMNKIDEIRVESIELAGYQSHKVYNGHEVVISCAKHKDAVNIKNALIKVYEKGYHDGLQHR